MPERPVWENLSVYSLPVVYGHQHSGQPTQCLDGLVRYAAEISGDAAWKREVESLAVAQNGSQAINQAPVSQGQAKAMGSSSLPRSWAGSAQRPQ